VYGSVSVRRIGDPSISPIAAPRRLGPPPGLRLVNGARGGCAPLGRGFGVRRPSWATRGRERAVPERGWSLLASRAARAGSVACCRAEQPLQIDECQVMVRIGPQPDTHCCGSSRLWQSPRHSEAKRALTGAARAARRRGRLRDRPRSPPSMPAASAARTGGAPNGAPQSYTASRPRDPGPTYLADGRINRPSRFCSRMWALHPAVRAHVNSGVNSSGGTSA
jgi:hypothetical protein